MSRVVSPVPKGLVSKFVSRCALWSAIFSMLWMRSRRSPVTVGHSAGEGRAVIGADGFTDDASSPTHLFLTCAYATLSVRRRIAIPHISHASWLLGRGGLYQVRDISSSCVFCARLLWHVLDIDQVGLVVADFHWRWRPGLDVLHNVGIEVFDGLQD